MGAASPKYEWITVPSVYYDFGSASPNGDRPLSHDARQPDRRNLR